MTQLPAKVLLVDRLADQYLITVKVCENHRCTFDKLNFGENKPTLGSYRNGWLRKGRFFHRASPRLSPQTWRAKPACATSVMAHAGIFGVTGNRPLSFT